MTKKSLEPKKTKEVQFIKKAPAHLRLRLKPKIMLKNLQIKKEKKNKPDIEWIRTIYEIIKQLPADNDKYCVKYKPETDTYNNVKDNKIIFLEDDFDYNAKRRGEKRKILYTPEELRFIANKRKKIFENPPRNNIEKIKNEVKPKAKGNKSKKIEVVEISDDEEPKVYSNILTKIETIKDIINFLATLENDTHTHKKRKRLNLHPRILMRNPKRKSTTNTEDLIRTRKKRKEPKCITVEQLIEPKRKRKEKQRLKARQDTVEGLQDFSKFIRDKSLKKDKKGLIVVMEKH